MSHIAAGLWSAGPAHPSHYSSGVAIIKDRESERTAELASIEATYARYESSGREKIWDQKNRGYSALAIDLRRSVQGEIRRSVINGGTVADLGCGTGELATEAQVVGLGLDWIGVDLRAEPIAQAQSRLPFARFIVASADDLPLTTSSVDVAVAQVLFSSLPSPQLEESVAGEISRVLKPGGWLVWLDIRYSNPTNRAVHGIGVARLKELFPDWHRDVRSTGLIPPVARRLGPTASVLYPLLALIPPLRSHIVGRLRRPAS